MHFLDFLEERDGRTLKIMQFPIPVTLLLQYIGDLQTCFPFFRGNCCTVNGMTITLQHLKYSALVQITNHHLVFRNKLCWSSSY